MRAEEVIQKRTDVIARSGPWKASNIHLGGDVYTMSEGARTGDEVRLRRVLQVTADLTNRPFHDLRVLDLACNEGMFAVELARHGAKVVGVEGREANIAKARFVKQVLCLENLDLQLGDVRDVRKGTYGQFDVVLCLGILYHLDAPDVFTFLENVSSVCERCLIIDTHVSLRSEERYEYEGSEYWGRFYPEHEPDSPEDEKLQLLWASVDNVRSFWFTRPSLYNFLSRCGFTSIYECHHPPQTQQPYDRVTIAALKGRGEQVLCCPGVNDLPLDSRPENQPPNVHPTQRPLLGLSSRREWLAYAGRAAYGHLPLPTRRLVRQLWSQRIR